MDYKEAVRYLDSFINYEKIGYKSQRSFKLARMRYLAELFGNPQDSFPAVHITGTKGKGSVASFTAGILKDAGFRVGLYTSPHLVTPRERIKLNGRMIEEEDFAYYAGELKTKLEEAKPAFSPTFFEIYTILAFNYFRAKSIDYGVIEVGLGGRLDATNIVNPLVAVITPVSYDHTHILGGSLGKIAVEKSGIIKKGCIAVSAPQEKSALKVIKAKCEALNVELILVGKDVKQEEICHDDEKEIFNIRGALKCYRHCVSRLLGRHQITNASSAAAAAECLARKGVKISGENIKNGIEMTKNPGRCEVISKNPYVILDGAQNKASARALGETIRRNFNYKRLILILGISKEKDIKGVCGELSPIADITILTKSKIKRAEEPLKIKHFVKTENIILTKSVSEAFKKAENLAASGDLVLITGSFFVLGEVYPVPNPTTRSYSYRKSIH